ncbi:Conserved_hypothetical protein [Hexamita inflata]|uniref:Uncharacterized protein n=1 Tax=Hexamita inflata TaxID=28002 RepID=A0AA86R5I5_9EUKA|nr:Conserved hypothetical protein [Hexamita inflata]CAI9972038.1 Conserved hypothetical protein [Hexamita inflata]
MIYYDLNKITLDLDTFEYCELLENIYYVKDVNGSVLKQITVSENYENMSSDRILICNNQIHVVLNDQIYKLENEFKFICNLPGNDLKLKYQPVFSRDNEIYCITKFGAYVLIQNKFKLCSVFNIMNENIELFEYCDKHIIIIDAKIYTIDKYMQIHEEAIIQSNNNQYKQVLNHILIYSNNNVKDIDKAFQIFNINTKQLSDESEKDKTVIEYEQQLLQKSENEQYIKYYIASYQKDHQKQKYNKYKRSNKLLYQCQLMNVIKLLPSLNYYLVIEDNYIYIINNFRQIIGKFQTTFQFYSGMTDNSINEDSPCVALPILYQSTICKGDIYVLNINKLYRVNNNELQFIMNTQSLEETKASYGYLSCIVQLNDRLFACVSADKVIEIDVNNKTVLQTSLNGYLISFCNKLYQLNNNLQIQQVKDNLELFDAIITMPRTNMPICLSGGLILAVEHTEIQNKEIDIFCCNLIDQTSVQKKLDETASLDNELGSSGIQVNQNLVNQLLDGNSYSNQVSNCYNNYINQQIERFPHYLSQAQYLILEAQKQYLQDNILQQNQFIELLSDIIIKNKLKIVSNLQQLQTKQLTMVQLFEQMECGTCDQ